MSAWNRLETTRVSICLWFLVGIQGWKAWDWRVLSCLKLIHYSFSLFQLSPAWCRPASLRPRGAVSVQYTQPELLIGVSIVIDNWGSTHHSQGEVFPYEWGSRLRRVSAGSCLTRSRRCLRGLLAAWGLRTGSVVVVRGAARGGVPPPLPAWTGCSSWLHIWW